MQVQVQAGPHIMLYGNQDASSCSASDRANCWGRTLDCSELKKRLVRPGGCECMWQVNGLRDCARKWSAITPRLHFLHFLPTLLHPAPNTFETLVPAPEILNPPNSSRMKGLPRAAHSKCSHTVKSRTQCVHSKTHYVCNPPNSSRMKGLPREAAWSV